MVEMEKGQRKIYLDWKNFGNVLELLLSKINKSKPSFTGVYGPPRGGVSMAAYFSHHLNIPYLSEPKEGCLIVDDISDSGNTLKQLTESMNLYTTATIHLKEKSIFIPTHYAVGADDNHWIVYPWEKK